VIPFLALIPGGAKAAIAAASLVAVVGGVLWYGSSRYDAGEQAQQAKQAVIDADRARDALAESEKNRATEAALRGAVERQRIIYDALQQKHTVALAGQRAALADAGKLRDDIAAYASGGGGTPDNPGPSASARAAALGVLLADALRTGAESAAGAETSGDAVRALLAAWPRPAVTP
jgi:dienelactone hydrolase